jgi:hypothetical protein
MKKIASIFILSLLTFGIQAQTNATQGAGGNWQPVTVTTGGANTLNGVEVNYLLGDNVVIIKLVNHTTSAVKATWNDGILTKNGQSLTGNNTPESVTIAPKIRVSDDDGNTVQVTIRLSDFHTKAADFKNFIVSNFDVIATN